MISTILTNLAAFAMSMPTNMIIILLVCIIMKVCLQRTITDCIYFIIGYLVIGLLLGIFGITMPNFMTVGKWITTHGKQIIQSIW